MGFSQALSGLNAAASSLDVQGNNIANSQTVGFKSSSAQFADVFANSRVGLGTRVSAVLQDFSEGNLEATSRNLDLGISGQGFFRFEQADQVVYSRNGQLTMTPDGYLQNAQGARIMGYGANAAGEVLGGGQPEVLQVASDEMPASATTQVATTFNLDSREVAGQGLNTAEMDDGTQVPYHFSNNFTAYDSLGNPRNFSVYYEKTAANAWDAKVAMDGYYDAANDFTLSFDNNGGLTAPGTPPTINVANNNTTPLGTGPAALSFDLNLAGSTQFGNTSTTSSLTQNGFTSGTLVGINIENDGTVVRNYSNEQSLAAGQIVMANFRNPEGLNPQGDNVWSATQASGQELVGPPGTGLLGTIESGAIETSNVDMARELVNMIVTQRAYQANSKTIQTQDEVLQTAINLR
ncbi:flagellar hook protein FlgE [Halomonas daqiaonensis]|uniref:Flagellar hook protein FlgE n=1 Tax=Halomonas daqiaonensis TaxID=650850 RepID=A0A1H7SRB5_9GAMM|nr:flagellar hook protein FlgE [Halomonas daqiaonensis]SEL74636.1 flagellar hook protein FlgE [Halomonas daqiaonensis]